MVNKTPEQNREGWRNWWNKTDAEGNYINRKTYLKKKLIKRINDGEIIKLKTLRKYGLLKYYKKNIDRNQSKKLKFEINIEPAILADPDPFMMNGKPSLESMGNFITTKPIEIQEDTGPIDYGINDDTFGDDDFLPDTFSDLQQPAPQPPTTSTTGKTVIPANVPQQNLIDLSSLPTNKKIASEMLRKRQAKVVSQSKVPKNYKFTYQDAVKALTNPNLISLNTLKHYEPSSINKILSRLRSIINVMKCFPNWNGRDKKALEKYNGDLKLCFKNPRILIRELKKKYKSWKDYVSVPVVLANADQTFAVYLGDQLKKYRNIQQEGIEKALDKQELAVEEEVVIDWNKYIAAAKKQIEIFDKLYKAKKNKVETVTKKDKEFIINLLLLVIPVLKNPARDDWGKLEIISKRSDATNSLGNYFVNNKKQRIIILRNYKTKAKYGEKQWILMGTNAHNGKNGRKLGTIINKSLQLWNRSHVITKADGTLYGNTVKDKNGNLVKDGATSGRLKIAMEKFGLTAQNPRMENGKKKPLGYNDYRHSFVSYHKNSTPATKRGVARDLLHSKAMSERYMRLLGDKILNDVEK